MGLIIWIFSGILVAWLTYTFWPKSPFGTMGDFAIAVFGGIIGGFLSTILFPSLNPMYNITAQGFFVSLIVALAVLVAYRIISFRLRSSRVKPTGVTNKETTP